MDKRITEKIKQLTEEAHEKTRQEILLKEERRRDHHKLIEKSMPSARKWVEHRLLDIVAKTIAENKTRYNPVNELDLQYCDDEVNNNRNIPVEAKAAAAKEIDGLYVREVWVPESQNPNDESGRTWDEAHTKYYVSWGAYGKH